MRGELQVLETGDAVGNDAHDDGATAALAKDVHAEARDAIQAVGNIGGALLFQFAGGVIIVAEDGARDVAGVRGDRALESFERQFDELAIDLDLGSASGRENQVADMAMSLQHGEDELRHWKVFGCWPGCVGAGVRPFCFGVSVELMIPLKGPDAGSNVEPFGKPR